jgi:hypothetical protein
MKKNDKELNSLEEEIMFSFDGNYNKNILMLNYEEIFQPMFFVEC